MFTDLGAPRPVEVPPYRSRAWILPWSRVLGAGTRLGPLKGRELVDATRPLWPPVFQSNVAASNAKLALFYDWLFFSPEKDSIMNIGM